MHIVFETWQFWVLIGTSIIIAAILSPDRSDK